eukprot:TRINITY_DN102540_c0_g1_i1.p1 TRINITY_DN102540_c0_g1~~TRINITY_DN102540_c0_g1_i1.p1  ORF type:complete len:685 (+),score=114.50 TRINITY_DN102540_c0_g1_i1:23-2056(+)
MELSGRPFDDTLVSSRKELRLPVSILRLATHELSDLSLEEPICDRDVWALREVISSLQDVVGNWAGHGAPEGAAEEHDEEEDAEEERQEKQCVSNQAVNGNWKQELLDVFKEIDVDGSGKVSLDEMREAMLAVGVPRARLPKLFSMADENNSGEIDLQEWLHIVDDLKEGEVNDVAVFGRKARRAKSAMGSVFHKEKGAWCMLHPLSKFRVAWDILVLGTCCSFAVVQPFTYAFQDKINDASVDIIKLSEYMMDVMFMCDVVLTFRTGYFETTDSLDLRVEMDWKRVAVTYFKSWLLVDVVSAFPVWLFVPASDAADLQITKILKIGKLSKIIKMLLALPNGELERFDCFEDILHITWLRFFYRRGNVVLAMVLLCHWMACAIKLVDEGFLKEYEHDGLWTEYVVAVYWSMTTLTTVGYGDITPTTDKERLLTIVAMVVGGAFYGIVVGSISSLVAQSDLNASAFYERMDLIYAWSEHNDLPRRLRILVCRYFRHHFSQRSAAQEAQLWNDLSPELQKEVGAYIVHEDVRYNPIFDGVPFNAVVRVQSILHSFSIFAGRTITSAGDAGSAMFMITQGTVQHSQGHVLQPGQSFGEEVLLGFKQNYEYTTIAKEDCILLSFMQDELLHLFQANPNVLEIMRRNVLSNITTASKPAPARSHRPGTTVHRPGTTVVLQAL